MKALTIAMKDLRLRLRDRSAIFQAFVAPFVLAVIISLAFGGGGDDFSPKYLVVDNDGGIVGRAFTDGVVKNLESNFDFDSTTASKALLAMDKGVASAAFVIPAGASEAFVQGKKGTIEVIRNPSRRISGDVAESIARGFVSQLDAGRLSVAAASSGRQLTAEETQRMVARAQQLRIPVQVVQGDIGTRPLKPASYFGPSMAIFFLFFTVQFGAKSLLAEKAEGTLSRITASPTSPSAIIFGKVISVMILGMTSLAVLLTSISLILKAPLGDFLAVAVLCFAMVFAAMAITAFVMTFARTAEQADAAGSLVTLGLTLLGGNFVPLNQAPELFRKLSLLTPNGWALRSFTDLVTDGGGIETILPALGAICAFGVVTGSIALVRIRKVITT